MTRPRHAGLFVTLTALGACAGGSARRPAALPPGCPVEVLHGERPARPIHALGEVVARCRGDAADDPARCTRELQDQACALGATMVWAVDSRRTDDGLEMRAFAGRER